MTTGWPEQELLLPLISFLLLIEPVNADLWKLDVMAYMRNCFVCHSTSFRVNFSEARVCIICER